MSHTVLSGGFLSYYRDWETRIGAFLEWDPERRPSVTVDAAAVPALSGLPFAVKDNIAVQDFHLTCGSRLLEDFIAPYTATAVARLEDAGARVVGKTNLDEFGMGSSTDNSALKRTNNPWDSERVAGGSSGGSAAAVAAGLVPFALGTDTGGSVRQPAAFCGTVGLKPTYGAVSRFGLTAYASSLETIGILADTVARARTVFGAIRAPDPQDLSSLAAPDDAPPLATDPAERFVIGVPRMESGSLESATEAAFHRTVDRLAALGHAIVPAELPSLDYALAAYYTIATAEASANLARFDGIRYGRRPEQADNPDELINKTRGQGFGPEVKLRILLGTFVLRSGFQDRYYLRAQRIRSDLRRAYGRLLRGNGVDGAALAPGGPYCDAVLLPVYPTRAFPRGEAGLSAFQQKAADLFTCQANLAGLPALAFPAESADGLPIGMQLMGSAFSEGRLFAIAESYERAHPAARPAGFRAFWS